jgi:AraC-like DNA-binding protein
MTVLRTIDAIWAKRASEKMRGEGLPVEELLRKAAIKPYALNQKSARIPFYQHATLLELAATASGNKCFGLDLAANAIDPRDAGLLVYAGLSSRTFGQTLKVLERYLHVLNEAADVKTEVSGDLASVEFDISEPKARSLRQATEFAVVNLVRSLRFLTGTHLRPTEVRFAHSRSSEISRFERFFGCSVRFDARHHIVTFSRRQLALPIATADDRLHEILTSYCDEVLAQREEKSPHLRHQVERIAMRLLSRGEANVRNVAQELGMSVRTFARRMKDTSATFAEILDQLRSDLAQKYLSDADLTLSQIAFLLGYSEVSAFSHAFKRWTGVSPGEWRLTHAG